MNCKLSILSLLILMVGMMTGCNKKDKNDPAPNNNSGSSDAVLVIENGGGKTGPGEKVAYTAHLVDKNGNVISANNITWSTGSSSVASASGNTISASGTGQTTVTATVSYNGSQITASVPLLVEQPTVFDVLPGAIVWEANVSFPGPLEPVYIGTGNPGTYTFSSSNSSVVTVDASGNLSFPGAGEATITVTAPGLDGSPKVQIPVLILGAPAVTLPITRVEVKTTNNEIFKTEQTTYTAKAYNSAGQEVTNTTFTWSILNDTLATIDATSGVVTGKHTGQTKIQALASGIIGEADLKVVPSTFIEVTPFLANIAAGKTRQFTANTYNVTRAVGGGYTLTATSNPADLKWVIPVTGIAIFDFATVDNNGLVSVNSNATVGMSTIVAAGSPSDADIEAGGGLIMVSDCACGAGSGSITTDQSSYSLGMVSSPTGQINVTSGGAVGFCSQDPGVVNVDASSGSITAVSPGTGTITICNGDNSTTVTVTVTMQ